MEEEHGFQEDFVDSLIQMAHSHDQDGSFVLTGDRFESVYIPTDVEILEIVARENPEDPEERMEFVHRMRVPLDSNSLEITDVAAVSVRIPGIGEPCPGTILSETSCYRDVEVLVRVQDYLGWIFSESAELDRLWNKCQSWLLSEEAYDDCVYWKVGEVAAELRQSLQRGIERVASVEPPDYHPHTNEVVRDHVHPSLYPFIKGVSQLKEPQMYRKAPFLSGKSGEDFWGRLYEASVYQWLPAQFFVDENGRCSIKSYINNLSWEKHPDLYTGLEQLFEVFLPHFQEVCNAANYCMWTEFGGKLPELINRELQVVVKIVDYEMTPGKAFEGVWHVEGMSHENIVSTGLYVIERSEHILGGDLLFKRPFLPGEASDLGGQMPQSRHYRVDEIVTNGLVPIGKVRTQEGAIIVFPNSHVHKVDMLWNSGEEFGRRRIIVFFLVNPLVEIISSRSVEPQQGVIPRSAALQHRLRLMEERKRHKQTWNLREIELCEH
ncbi:hypothetical protein BSKO_06468 [Bryopsis sp. KO-2023]|nr:hypothetical protein BSKO_06468 [Bryopsis sp. KO-2023]